MNVFVRKYMCKSTFNDNNYTISIDDVINITKQYLIEKVLAGVMFLLITKNTLGFNQFCAYFFNEDPIRKNNLTILPICFKLPFNLEQYLSMKNFVDSTNKDIKNFMDKDIC